MGLSQWFIDVFFSSQPSVNSWIVQTEQTYYPLLFLILWSEERLSGLRDDAYCGKQHVHLDNSFHLGYNLGHVYENFLFLEGREAFRDNPVTVTRR